MSTTTLRARVEGTPLVAKLAVGDALALTAFFAIGAQTHGLQPLSNPLIVAESVAPFLLTWALAGVVAGLFQSAAIATPRRAVTATLPAWVLGGLAGHGLRATAVLHGDTAVSFILVSLVVGGTFLVGWRVLAAVATNRK